MDTAMANKINRATNLSASTMAPERWVSTGATGALSLVIMYLSRFSAFRLP